MPLRFAIDETKALEALVLVAKTWPGITPFFVAKVFFLAEKWHLNRFGRPIIGDTYAAMQNGPVPSAIYDIIKGNLDLFGNSQDMEDALQITRSDHHPPKVDARRDPVNDVLSDSDVECLKEAIAFCQPRNFKTLSNLTHAEPAWREAWERAPNSFMDYEPMIDDGERKERIVEEAREFSRYGLL